MVRTIILTMALATFGMLTANLLTGDDCFIDPKYAKSREFKVGDTVFFKDNAIARRGDEILNPHYTINWPSRIEKIEGDRLWLGRAYILKNEVMSVEESFDSADQEIQRNPNSWLGWRARGLSWVAKGEPGKGLKDFDQALLLDPQAAVAYADRAEIKGVLSDFDGAVKDLDQAIRFSLKRTRPVLYINRGSAKLSKLQYVEAIKDFDTAIELDPGNPDAYFWRAKAKYKLGHRAAAMRDFDQTIRFNPTHKVAYWERARIKSHYKDLKGAVKDFNECIRLDPDNVDLLIERGWASHKLGNYTTAIEDYTKAAELDDDSHTAKCNLAFLLATCPDANLRDAVKSIQWSEAALRLKPSSAYAMNAKACGMALLGKFDKAILLEHKALQSIDYANDKNIDGGKRSPNRIAAWKAKQQWFVIPGEAEPPVAEEPPAPPTVKPRARSKTPAAPPRKQKQDPIPEDSFMRA